jgi:2'-5' RNA ligase
MRESRDIDLFAVVAYVPDPLATFLHELRGAMPGLHNPRPHITILPPRPLRISPDAAAGRVAAVLDRQMPFEVELVRVCSFAETNIVYLDVGDGLSQLHAVHAELSDGDLEHQEEFPFRPHVTLGGPVDDADLPFALRRAEEAWQAVPCSPRFLVNEIVALWLTPGSAQNEWQRLWSCSLIAHGTAPWPRVNSAVATNRRY